jgi:hypothetical protein
MGHFFQGRVLIQDPADNGRDHYVLIRAKLSLQGITHRL